MNWKHFPPFLNKIKQLMDTVSNQHPKPKATPKPVISSTNSDPQKQTPIGAIFSEQQKANSAETKSLRRNWDVLYSMDETPWNMNQPSFSLEKYVISHLSPNQTILVTGCGTGYDVIQLGHQGFQATGIDISPTALAIAEKNKSQHLLNLKHSLSTVSPNLENAANLSTSVSSFNLINENLIKESSNIQFLEKDLFTWIPPQKFDAIFDYTCLCAFHPQLRQDWANSMKRLLSDTGTLFTQIFPVIPGTQNYSAEKLPNTPDVSGPPYPLSLKLAKDLLEPIGFILIKSEAIDPSSSHPKRAGKEYMMQWKLPKVKSCPKS